MVQLEVSKVQWCGTQGMCAGAFVMAVLGLAGGCGKSAPGMDEVPLYPNATSKEAMEVSDPLGIVSAGLVQFTTSDTHEQVLSFYKTALAEHEPKVTTQELPDGKVTSIELGGKDRTTVAIQEYKKDKHVVITFMGAR